MARRFLTALLATAAVVFATPLAASASDETAPTRGAQVAPVGVGIDEVYRGLGITDRPVEYVVVVDTSRSMSDGRRYESVRVALRRLLDGLGRDDHVTLITFDSLPAIVYTGPPSAGAIDAMPSVADGDATDIGAALDKAFAVVEGGSPAAKAAVVLLTDGERHVPPTSRYGDPAGAGWRELERRGAAVAARTAGYALPLESGETAADDLVRVLPGTVKLAVRDPDEVIELLSRFTERLRRAEAVRLVTSDIGKGVRATWSPFPTGADLSRPVTATLTLRSDTAVVPLWVDGLRVQVDGIQATATSSGGGVLVAPGGAADVAVTITVTEAAGLRLGEQPTDVDTRLRVTGRVDSPWSAAVADELGIDLKPPRLDAGAAWPAVWTTGVRWLYVVGTALLVLIALIAALVAREVLRPRLSGEIEAQSADGPLRRVRLRGRVQTFDRPPSQSDHDVGGHFEVRSRRGEVVVTYFPRPGSPSQPRRLIPGVELDVYGIMIRYLRP